MPRVPLVETDGDLFVHMADYSDMLSFTVGGPDSESPYFRMYHINLVFDSLAVLEEKWQIMETQLKLLIEDITRLNNLPPVEVVFLDVA